jgi:hypothetical protein
VTVSSVPPVKLFFTALEAALSVNWSLLSWCYEVLPGKYILELTAEPTEKDKSCFLFIICTPYRLHFALMLVSSIVNYDVSHKWSGLARRYIGIYSEFPYVSWYSRYCGHQLCFLRLFKHLSKWVAHFHWKRLQTHTWWCQTEKCWRRPTPVR